MHISLHILLIIFYLQFVFASPIHADQNTTWASAEPATREVIITGFTRAHATIPVTTEVAGKIKKIFADIGEPIPHNGKFACLDETFVDLDIESADNEIAQHLNDINYYKKETDRHETLTVRQVSPVNVLDRLIRDLINSQRAMQDAKIRKQRLTELKKRHCMVAPPGWLVIDRLIEEGQWVHEGEVVGHVGDYSKLIIPLLLTEQELASLKKTKKIEILLAERNVKVPALIETISPDFDEGTRKISVELIVQDGLPEKRGGIRGELTLMLPKDGNEYLISQNALEQRFDEYWLYGKNGISIRVNLVKTGINGKVIVKSPDIKAGDKFRIIR